MSSYLVKHSLNIFGGDKKINISIYEFWITKIMFQNVGGHNPISWRSWIKWILPSQEQLFITSPVSQPSLHILDLTIKQYSIIMLTQVNPKNNPSIQVSLVPLLHTIPEKHWPSRTSHPVVMTWPFFTGSNSHSFKQHSILLWPLF